MQEISGKLRIEMRFARGMRIFLQFETLARGNEFLVLDLLHDCQKNSRFPLHLLQVEFMCSYGRGADRHGLAERLIVLLAVHTLQDLLLAVRKPVYLLIHFQKAFKHAAMFVEEVLLHGAVRAHGSAA